MTKIAVTGAAGLVGGNLIRALLADGEDVRAIIHHDQRALMGLDVEIISADLGDPQALAQAFSGCNIVYHLASLISLDTKSWDEVARVNIDGTRNVIQACQKGGVRRLIHFSSIHTLEQEPFDQSLDETRPYISDPKVLPYARSKILAEQEILHAVKQGFDAVIIIPTAIVGPYDFRPSYVGQSLKMLAEGRLPALIKGGYDWVDVRDVVDGARQAARLAPSGRRYLLSGHWHSIREVAEMVAQISGTPASRLTFPLKLADLAEPIMVSVTRLSGGQPLYTRSVLETLRSNPHMDHSRATRELDYTARPLAETLEDTLQWFREQANPS